MNHKQIDIERAADSINAERAVDYEERVTLKIQEIMADPGELWGALEKDSMVVLQVLMVNDINIDHLNAAAFALREAVRRDVAKAAALDVAPIEPASREDAIDYLEMWEGDGE